MRVTRRRSAFVEAGLELFGTRMYNEVTVADILKTARQNRRSFYELFDDRESLLRAVENEAVTARVVELLAEMPVLSGGDSSAALRLLDAVFDFYSEDPRRAHVAFVTVVGVSRTMEEHRRAQIASLASAFTQATAGLGGTPLDRHAAVAFLGAFSELMIDHLWVGGSRLEEVRAELHRLALARFFNPLGT